MPPCAPAPSEAPASNEGTCCVTAHSIPPAPFTLGLLDQSVLLVGGDAGTEAYLEGQGAVVRRIDGPAVAADLDGVQLVLLRADDAASRQAAQARGVLTGVLPAALPDAAPGRVRRASLDGGSSVAGRASLVGAGPGAADLLTVRAVQAIRSADVLLYDKLVGADVLALAPPGARRIDVGKRCGRHAMSQASINALIVRHAQAGAHVVRLKGGDPFVFGRGGEELESLRLAGVPTEVVPGITAALAAAARLGIPLTHRGASRSLHLITAHGADDRLPEHDWSALARAGGTLAVYMGKRTLPLLAARLLAAGMAADTPAVAVENATLPNERRMPGTLAGLAELVAAAGLDGPTLVLIGAVVAMADFGVVEEDGVARHAHAA